MSLKWSRKQKIGTVIVACVVVAGAAGGIAYRVKAVSGDSELVTKETTVQTGTLTVGVTENGNVEIDALTQSYSLGNSTSSSSSSSSSSAEDASGGGASQMGNSSSSASDASLVVEEVYVSVGEQVSEGDALLKLTEDSIEEVGEDYESAYEEAKEDYEDAKTTQSSQKLSAEYTYKQAVAQGESAKATYKATLASLEAKLTSAKASYQEAKNKIASLPAEIKALKKQIKKLKNTESGAMQEDSDVQSMTDSISSSSSSSSSTSSSSTTSTSSSSSSSTLSQLKQELSEKQSELAQYKANLYDLKTAYHSAVKAQKTGKIEAKATYEQSLLSAKNAKATYQTTLASLKESVKEAKETYTDAKEALEEFEEYTANGVVAAEYSGVVSSVGYAVGDSLSSSTEIATFLDADAVTVTVAVSEEDISNIEVGSTANIYLSAYEDVLYTGEVTSISTTSSGDSTVSYPVVVTITSDVSDIYSGMTAEVTFVSKEVEDVLYVSNKAITTEGTKSYVLLQNEDGSTEQVEVTTGFSDGHNVEIQSGLSEGDTVLIESQVSE